MGTLDPGAQGLEPAVNGDAVVGVLIVLLMLGAALIAKEPD
jgi:hypothetical protein